MQLIVGLGNPGQGYKDTRHNVGFWFADEMAEMVNIFWEEQSKFEAYIAKGDTYLIVKPQTFMNASGRSVKTLVNYYKISTTDIYVAHDDLDIKLGEFKINFEKGPKLHNGVTSIESALGDQSFHRIRLGVDNRDPQNRTAGEEYVLGHTPPAEKEILRSVIKESVAKLISLING
jgi:PTH1 family peptidyl-tRNA hydrolase